MWHQWFNRNFRKLREYFLCAKKTKILESIIYVNNVCNVCTQIRCLCSDQSVNNVNSVSAYGAEQRTEYVVYVCDTPHNGAIGWRRGDELLNKVVIFVFFAHKKYSRSYVKLRLNHWCQRALRMHQKYYNLCSEVLRVWNDMRGSN